MLNNLNFLISSVFKNNILLYHGCSDTESFKGIQKNGLLPKVTKDTKGKNGKYTPMVNSVYLSKSLAYALMYAFNGNAIGHPLSKSESEDIKKNKISRFGYVFIFDSNNISDNIKPDEDSVGELFYCKVNGKDYQSEKGYTHIAADDIPEFIIKIARYYAAENTYKKAARYDDYGDLCRIGKIIIKHLSDIQKTYLANLVDSISVIGNVMPSHCYKVDKLDREKYNEDGSNFFELAEKIY